MRRDFVITDGLRGPGRFLGCAIGVRVIDGGDWYGEGEMKLYRDGDDDLPTICGTGLEDYVGSAWGLGPHAAPYGGAPLVVQPPGADPARSMGTMPDFVGFYRWHHRDPLMFEREARVTIQQIGAAFFGAGEEERFAAYQMTNPVAGNGWIQPRDPGLLAWGIAERVDDVCSTAYVYCRDPQPVPPLDVAAALADIERRPYEPAAADGAVARVSADVLVVGAGPAGLVAGITLAHYGARVVVLSDHELPSGSQPGPGRPLDGGMPTRRYRTPRCWVACAKRCHLRAPTDGGRFWLGDPGGVLAGDRRARSPCGSRSARVCSV